MSHKREITESDLDAEEQAKDLELNEQPKPTRKISNPNIPVSSDSEPSIMYRIKGNRKTKR